MEYNLSLAEGLDKVLRWMEAHDGMWPMVAFRMLAVPEGEALPSQLSVLAVHFQASPTPQATRSKVTLPAPLVIEGVVTINDFSTLLRQWAAGLGGVIDHWYVQAPSGLANFWWQVDVPVAVAQFPLIEDLPPLPTTYREARLSGTGTQIEPKLRTWLQDRLFDLDPAAHTAVFSRDYLSLGWGMDTTYLLIHMPLAVGMKATYNHDERLLVVEIHFRPPLSPADLEVRVGTGLYDASLDVHVPEPVGTDVNGWDLAKVEVGVEPGGAGKVWLSRRGMEAAFGWELTVDFGRASTPSLKRERFVADWYRYAHKDLAQEVEVRLPGTGKGDRPGDALELALANACGALGYGVLFAGHLLKSAGVDLIAFDETSGRAYVVSATIGNDIIEKLRTWLAMEPLIVQDLMPEWTPRPVIITSQSRSTLITEELRACHSRRVLVLSAEDLASLKELPPDIQMFGRTLGQDPPEVPTPGSRRF